MIVGDNGNFRPDDSVSRNEMAVIMAKLILGTYEADSYVGSHPFTDVPSWASRYVAACYNSGIISGRGEGIYDGASTVTAVEAAAMMLRALGYEDLSLGATQWDQPVAAKANEINLFKGLSGNSQTPMDRNSVAQLALNTLEATMVRTTRTGQDITLPGGIVIASTRTYVDREDVNGRDYLEEDGAPSGDNKLQLCEHLYDKDLTKDTGKGDDFGRPATTWSYDGKEVISVANDATLTYTKEVKAKDIYKALNLREPKNDVKYFVNGDTQADATLNSSATDTLGSGNGTLTQVYKDGDDVTITVIETFLAQVSGDYDEDDEELTIAAVSDDSALGTVDYTLKLEDFANLADFSDEDYVLFTAVTDGTDATVKTLVPAEVVTATVNGYTEDKDGNEKDVTFDGKTYEYNVNFDDQDLGTTYTVKEESVFIMDGYGYVIGLDKVASSDDYVFLLEFKSDGWNTSKTVSANAYFTDGTNKDIKLEKVNGKSITDVAPGAPDDTEVETADGTFYPGWYTYTEKDGKYRVTEVNDTADPTVVGNSMKVTENGKTTINLSNSGSTKGSDKTILVVKDGNDIDVYTGVKEMPTITAAAASDTFAWAAEKSNGYASYVFVDVAGGTVVGASNASGDLIFIMDETSFKKKYDEDDNVYYLYDKAIVNGKSESVKSANIIGASGLYHHIRYDENDFVDGMTLAVHGGDYIVDASLSGASVKGEGRSVDIGGTEMRLADEFVIRVVTDENKMVTIKDAEALNNRYKNKVVDDGELWAALKDDEVTTLILVVDSVGDPPSGSAAVAAVYQTDEQADITLDAASNKITIGGVDTTVTGASMTLADLATAIGNTSLGSSWDVAVDGTAIKLTNQTPGVATLTGVTEVTKGEAAKAASGSVELTTASDTVTFDGTTVTYGDADVSTATSTTNGSYQYTFVSNVFSVTAVTAGDAGNKADQTATVGGAATTWQVEGGADAIAAVYKLENAAEAIAAATKQSKTITLGGHDAVVTKTAVADYLAEFIADYNAKAAKKDVWTASVEGNRVLFTAKSAGAIDGDGPATGDIPAGTTVKTAGADAVTP